MSLKTRSQRSACIFASLAEDYPESNLAKCKTVEKQKWRHVSSDATMRSDGDG